jgi:hypothetical protein
MIVPVACPIGRATKVSGGHSRTGKGARRHRAMLVVELLALIPELIVQGRSWHIELVVS